MLRLVTLIGGQCGMLSQTPGSVLAGNAMFDAYDATIDSQKAPPWAVFAFQTYIDMH
jgi:hypothetical protein